MQDTDVDYDGNITTVMYLKLPHHVIVGGGDSTKQGCMAS